MVTFEIDLDDESYERMCREIKMLRLIDDIDISRSTFINLAVFDFCSVCSRKRKLDTYKVDKK